MANNRLYIEDTSNGDRLFVAKSFGQGWDWRADSDAITNWLKIHVRDAAASFGNTDANHSVLVFRTENEGSIVAKIGGSV
jgi:hypothetical protein